MIHRELKIGRWLVEFLFATGKYNVKEISEALYDAGASKMVLRQSADLMWMCEYNCGFTFANPKTHRAVVVIGPTTSGAEFQDTFVHEIHHLAVAIADELGVDLEGESPVFACFADVLRIQYSKYQRFRCFNPCVPLGIFTDL